MSSSLLIRSLVKNPDLIQFNPLIAGKWLPLHAKFPVFERASGLLLGDVSDCTEIQTRNAISVASDTMKTWSNVTARGRAKILRSWYDLVVENKEDLARIVTAETGKPFREAVAEVLYGASYLLWFSEEAPRSHGDIIPPKSKTQRLFTIKQPIGVCGIITPFNFPVALSLRKIAPALAAGCTTVIKPSPTTPISILSVAQLGMNAGLPDGVVNIVTTSQKNTVVVGDELCTNKLVNKISFTGSTTTGKIVLKKCADTVKKVSLELGGNAAFIVFDDASLSTAITSLISAKFRNAGQACISANRVFVHRSIQPKFVAKLIEVVKGLKCGDPLNLDTDIGPISTHEGFAKCKRIIENAIQLGAKVEFGGDSEGMWIKPTILTDVNDNMDIAKEEVFGPVVGIFTFDTEEEGIQNRIKVGLANYIFAENMGRIIRVSEALESGMVGVNEGRAISSEVIPFGGWKESGLGREGSKYGLDEYLQVKQISIGNLSKL
ncbi:hypothetical protein HK098_002074 [Nowakowskiella sp. JEL0407]|nr:hypothetical protein HK098_002074 [Nowakowskiella sp. JEL0407]